MQETKRRRSGGSKNTKKNHMDESSPKENDDGISVRIGRDVLHCSECSDHLFPPCYQCESGHVVCSSCWCMLQNYCRKCHHEANYSRNIALERVIESIKVLCSYAKWGCGRTLCYAQMNEHKDTCLYAPSICPVPDCNYEGFTGWWSRHFLREHRSSAKRFGYEQSFQLYLKRYEPFLALLGQDGHLFLLNNCADTMGNCLSIVCLRPGNLKWKFYYDLMAFGRESSVQLKASVMNFKDWKDFDNNKYAFLLIPNNFLYSDVMPLTILIRKITSYDV